MSGGRILAGSLLALALAAGVGSVSAEADAEEAEKEEVQVAAVRLRYPFALIPGRTNVVMLRGDGLETVRSARLADGERGTVAILKQAKEEPPKGLNKETAGESALQLGLWLPSGTGSAPVQVLLENEAGTSDAVEWRVLAPQLAVEEMEPNNGFSDAKLIPHRCTVLGRIEQDKDVDIYELLGVAGGDLHVEVRAWPEGQVLDSVVQIFDSGGSLLTMNDDAEERDSKLSVVLPESGRYRLVVLDAHDSGSEAHGYVLSVRMEEAQP